MAWALFLQHALASAELQRGAGAPSPMATAQPEGGTGPFSGRGIASSGTPVPVPTAGPHSITMSVTGTVKDNFASARVVTIESTGGAVWSIPWQWITGIVGPGDLPGSVNDLLPGTAVQVTGTPVVEARTPTLKDAVIRITAAR